METRSYDCRMNSIFRNQPSYTYYNKSFSNQQDNVYQFLHEVDPLFTQPQEQANDQAFRTNVLVDPRTHKVISEIYYDHTRHLTRAFRSPKYSILNMAQHTIGVRIVKARQEGNELTEDDFLIWHRMESLRLKEVQEFQKFVYDFNQTHKEQLYAPAKRLMELYKKWYKRKANILLEKYPALSYNTHLGLPHLKVCKEPIKEQWAEITEVSVAPQKLHIPCPTINHSNRLKFKLLDRNLESFLEDYLNSESTKEQLEEDAKKEFLQLTNTESSENTPHYFIPLDSLMFILTAGDYIDLPTEMMLEIKENESQTDHNYIIMDLPIPSMQMGWHTFKHTAEQAVVALISLSNDYNNSDQASNDISACPQEPPVFQVQTFDNYLKSHCQKPLQFSKFSHNLSKWQLKAKDKDVTKQIYTLINTSPNIMDAYSIKLEHKPKFGCELMTKYELLREWFRLKLQYQTDSTCYRLDLNNFQTLLEESQNLTKLELQLSTTYHIILPQLLSNLYEFLSLLSSVSCGRYMLRYNPKFKEKFLLCRPSQEITQNTVHIHDLLKAEPSELLFMSQQSYIPIADDLCSLMHIEHKLLPCTFKPAAKLNLHHGNKKKTPKSFVPLNDKDWILARCRAQAKKKDDIAQQRTALYNAKKKKTQRARKTIRKRQRAKVEETVKSEMELDQEIFGI